MATAAVHQVLSELCSAATGRGMPLLVSELLLATDTVMVVSLYHTLTPDSVWFCDKVSS